MIPFLIIISIILFCTCSSIVDYFTNNEHVTKISANPNAQIDKESFDKEEAVVPKAKVEVGTRLSTAHIDRTHKIPDRVNKIDVTVSSKPNCPGYIIHYVKQRTDRWYRLRKGKVTGSNAYYIKNNSVYDAILRELMRDGRFFENEAMRRGRRLEPEGIALFSEKYGLKVDRVGFVESISYKDAGCSPDGIIYDKDGSIRAIVEHKAYNPSRHYECYRKIYTDTIYQMQFNMFITGAKEAYLVLYNPDIYNKDEQLLVKVMPRDPAIQSLFKDRFREYMRGIRVLTGNSKMLNRTTIDTSLSI